MSFMFAVLYDAFRPVSELILSHPAEVALIVALAAFLSWLEPLLNLAHHGPRRA